MTSNGARDSVRGSQKGSGYSARLEPLKAVKEAASQMQAVEADRVVLTGVLGRGSWGTVYKGAWRGLAVAVKTVVFSDGSGGALPLQRAITEAAVCASVNHRNVVAT